MPLAPADVGQEEEILLVLLVEPVAQAQAGEVEEVLGRLEPQMFLDQVLGRGRMPGLGEILLDLDEPVGGDVHAFRDQLPVIVPVEKLRGRHEGRSQALFEGPEVAFRHGQLGRPGIVGRGQDLRRPALASRVRGQEDLGPGLFHVIDVFPEGAAARVIDFQHLAVEALVEGPGHDLQDDGPLIMLDDLAADGQGLVVLFGNIVADLVSGIGVVLLDGLGPLAGGLGEGQRLGELPEGHRAEGPFELLLDEEEVLGGHRGEVCGFSAHVLSFLPIKSARMTFWTWSRFSAWS